MKIAAALLVASVCLCACNTVTNDATQVTVLSVDVWDKASAEDTTPIPHNSDWDEENEEFLEIKIALSNPEIFRDFILISGTDRRTCQDEETNDEGVYFEAPSFGASLEPAGYLNSVRIAGDDQSTGSIFMPVWEGRTPERFDNDYCLTIFANRGSYAISSHIKQSSEFVVSAEALTEARAGHNLKIAADKP